MARVLAYNARPFLLTATTALVIAFGCSSDRDSSASDGAAGESIAGMASGSPVSTAGMAGRETDDLAGGNDAGTSGAAGEGFAASGGQPSQGPTSAGGDSAGADGAAGSSGAAGRANSGGSAGTGVGGSNLAGSGGVAGTGGGMADTSGNGGVAGTGGVAGSSGGVAGTSGVAGSSGGAFAGTLPCEVRAVLSARCTTCHSSPPNNGAPMSLVSWDSVNAYAAAIHGAVSSGAMPPTGSLSTNEASILLSYVSSGAPSAANVTCP
jgi:hypothetical protein